MLSVLAACAALPEPFVDETGAAATGTRGDRYFPDDAYWYTEVTDRAVDPTSSTVITALQDHGWGLGRFQIDFSLEILEAAPETAPRSFSPTGDFYTPDCDAVDVPVPEGGNLEGESGYACENQGDCHLLVDDRSHALLYEMWRADIRGDVFEGGCLAVWEMDRVYGESGRGDQCTSADAAGYPIAPLLFTADEVAAGTVAHVLRLALPNTIIRDGSFHHPATHATNADGGGGEAVPYGAHLRLKSDFDLDRIEDPDAAPVVRALQTYGIVLADGGSVALMGRSDARTTSKWSDLFDSHGLVGIEPSDFELLELGEERALTFECERSP